MHKMKEAHARSHGVVAKGLGFESQGPGLNS
jgi:hypothetical protein